MFGVAHRRAQVEDAGAPAVHTGEIDRVVDQGVEEDPGARADAMASGGGEDGRFRSGHAGDRSAPTPPYGWGIGEGVALPAPGDGGRAGRPAGGPRDTTEGTGHRTGPLR